MLNRLVLEGIVSKSIVQKTSPSGVIHSSFVLEHRSFQYEAGLKRQAWCKVSVVASGSSLQSVIQQLIVGSKISVEGFISQHQSRNGLSKLVLHAEKITFLIHGE
ncbi:primosomal replication protein N [Thorsellia kenyensis]|uniref:Replication restart protein PriB n=1 Tax=Thorsellia kenyensis TaxID=1549888 RepID=A0ABV6CBF2_9GAMM